MKLSAIKGALHAAHKLMSTRARSRQTIEDRISVSPEPRTSFNIEHRNLPPLRFAGAVLDYGLNHTAKSPGLNADSSEDHNPLLFGHRSLTPKQISHVARVKFTHRYSLASQSA